MKKIPTSYTTITAILAIVALLIVAMLNGVDGALLATGCTVIAGLGGYYLSKRK